MSLIERATIESDEDGFHLIVAGDIDFDRDDWEDDDGVVYARRPLNFRLTADAAIQLLEQAHAQIAPWHTEGQSVLRDFEEHQRTGVTPHYVPRLYEEPGEIFDIDDDDSAERLREAVDHQRKARRENP